MDLGPKKSWPPSLEEKRSEQRCPDCNERLWIEFYTSFKPGQPQREVRRLRCSGRKKSKSSKFKVIVCKYFRDEVIMPTTVNKRTTCPQCYNKKLPFLKVCSDCDPEADAAIRAKMSAKAKANMTCECGNKKHSGKKMCFLCEAALLYPELYESENYFDQRPNPLIKVIVDKPRSVGASFLNTIRNFFRWKR